uniref:Uncharacterized protein n=1 Tax=Globisporangium ultimum (strain ATCC 200006 / CBS 805.95 / DAOM BR144) TaxID=431595 RepID=K3X3C6_GLOUD
MLEVRCAVFEHNHRTDEVIWRNNAISRQIPLPEPIAEDLRLMITCGGKNIRIWEHIRDRSLYKIKYERC